MERRAAVVPPHAHRGATGTPGLLSPGDRPIERGDPFTIAFGIWGALNCRAGFVVEDASELPDGTADYVERLVAPYFEAVAEWYGALHVGQVGGELQDIVDRHLGDDFFGIVTQPRPPTPPRRVGELTGVPRLDDRAPFGMALQCDIIPATGTPYFTTNIEDGVALADESLRAAFARSLPRCWAGSRPAGISWPTRSGSTCIQTCCRSPTSPPT